MRIRVKGSKISQRTQPQHLAKASQQPVIFVQHPQIPQQQQPIIIMQPAPQQVVQPTAPSISTNTTTSVQPPTYQESSTGVKQALPPAQDPNTKTYVLSEDNTKTAPVTTVTTKQTHDPHDPHYNPDPEQGGKYIGVPQRTYPSVECTFGRWLMWDAVARAWIAFMPSKNPPKGCCEALARCCGWVLWLILLPFTLILILLFGIIGFFADICVFFAWIFSFGFCCKRCKSRCDVVHQQPYHWFQSIASICTCNCG